MLYLEPQLRNGWRQGDCWGLAGCQPSQKMQAPGYQRDLVLERNKVENDREGHLMPFSGLHKHMCTRSIIHMHSYSNTYEHKEGGENH